MRSSPRPSRGASLTPGAEVRSSWPQWPTKQSRAARGANELVGGVRRSPWALRRRGPLAVMLLIPRGVRARFSREGGDQARRPGLPSQAETRSRTKLGLRIRTPIQMRADDGCVLAVSACSILRATGLTLILISLTTPRSTRHFTQSIASVPKASRAIIRMGTSNGLDGSTISPRASRSLVLASWRASCRRDHPLGTFSCRHDWQALPLDQRSNTP